MRSMTLPNMDHLKVPENVRSMTTWNKSVNLNERLNHLNARIKRSVRNICTNLATNMGEVIEDRARDLFVAFLRKMEVKYRFEKNLRRFMKSTMYGCQLRMRSAFILRNQIKVTLKD